MVEQTIEEKVDRLEREVQELRSKVRNLQTLINQLYVLDTSTVTPPDTFDDVYVPDDFGPALAGGKPSRVDRASYRLIRKARDSQKKIN